MISGVNVIIRGDRNTGRTTLAALIKHFLMEHGYQQVVIHDVLPSENKPDFEKRLPLNQQRMIDISVETTLFHPTTWRCQSCGYSIRTEHKPPRCSNCGEA